MLGNHQGHFQILAFSGKTFWNVTPYSVLASYLFLKIETVSSSMASVTLWHTMRSCRQEDISLQNRVQFQDFLHSGEDH